MNTNLRRELSKIEEITDGLGMPIDEGIRLPVAALRIHGFVTTGSCEGHPNRRTHGPYVILNAPDAAEYESKMRSVSLGGNAYRRLWKRLQRINLEERKRLSYLLDEFYVQHASKAKIIIINIGPGTSRLVCEGFEVAEASSSADHSAWLRLAQAEFASFADWLISRLDKSS